MGRWIGRTGDGMQGARVAALLALGVLLVMSPSAAATTFGAPLGTAPFTVAPNNPLDCTSYETLIGPAPVYGPAGPPSLAGSCIWIDVPTPSELGLFPGRNITLEPPGSGTVNLIRVATGATTGAMRVVVMRSLYRNTSTPGRPEDACCFPVAQSQVFVPRANSITAVRVDLPVREDVTPPPEDTTTIADFDTLGLAVLEPGVPVPSYYTGDLSAPADFLWNTSTPSTAVPGFYSDAGGFFVALDADWTAGSGGPIDFGTAVAPVSNGNATLNLGCLQLAACVGQVQLQNGRIAASDLSGAGAATRVTYGNAGFQIASGRRAALAVHLNQRGRRLLKRAHRAYVRANVTLRGAKPFASRIILKR